MRRAQEARAGARGTGALLLHSEPALQSESESADRRLRGWPRHR